MPMRAVAVLRALCILCIPARAVADEPAQQAAQAPPNDGSQRQLSIKGEAGYEYGWIFGVPVQSALIRAGIGRQNDFDAQYFTVAARYGLTSVGLTTWDLRVGGEGDLFRSGILRLGLGAEAGVLSMVRATNGNNAPALTIGVSGHAGADLVRWGPRDAHALTLDLRAEGHAFLAGVHFGPSLVLGLRY